MRGHVLAVVGGDGSGEWGDVSVEWDVGGVSEVVSGFGRSGKVDDKVTWGLGLSVRFVCASVRGSRGALGCKKYPR